MRLQYADRFQCAYDGLTDDDAEHVKKALRSLVESPRPPSLRVKRIQGTDHIWEASASLSMRLTSRCTVI
jgi:hypothetical protein